MPDRELLFLIARETGIYRTLSSSTSRLAGKLGISQQSVSRKLAALKNEGLIELSSSPKGVNVKLSHNGVSLLRGQFLELKALFGPKPTRSISGKLKTGVGRCVFK